MLNGSSSGRRRRTTMTPVPMQRAAAAYRRLRPQFPGWTLHVDHEGHAVALESPDGRITKGHRGPPAETIALPLIKKKPGTTVRAGFAFLFTTPEELRREVFNLAQQSATLEVENYYARRRDAHDL